MKTRKIFSALLAVLMILSAFTVSASAASATVKMTVDGQEKSFSTGDTVNLSGDGDFLYAEITLADQRKVLTASATLAPIEGASIVTHRVAMEMLESPEFRFGSHNGLRYVTMMVSEDFDALCEDPNIKELRIGTIIAPTEFIRSSYGFSKEGFERLQKTDKDVKLLDIPAPIDQWYSGTTRRAHYVFAGSIVGIKEENLNREFSGIGYIEADLSDGKTAVLYAPFDRETNADSIAGFSKFLLDTQGVSFKKTEQAQLKLFADKFVEANSRKTWIKDLTGLNVLAIGDSLFDGDFLSGEQQWIGLMAETCDWTFVNLGRDGWTVAKNPGAYISGDNERASIYDKLYNDSNFTFIGSNRSYKRGSTSGKDAEDVDLILLEGGVNDWGHNLPLGSLSDSDLAKGDNLYGAYNLILQKLLVDYPNATIICVTSWRVSGTRSDGAQRTDFAANAIVDLVEAKYYEQPRIQVIDAGDPYVSNIFMSDSSWRMLYGKSESDTNHLGVEGMKVMMEAMLPLIWEIMKK